MAATRFPVIARWPLGLALLALAAAAWLSNLRTGPEAPATSGLPHESREEEDASEPLDRAAPEPSSRAGEPGEQGDAQRFAEKERELRVVVVRTDGEPVSGAEVLTFPWNEVVRERFLHSSPVEQALALGRGPVVTDASGTIRIPWSGPVLVSARAPGLAPSGSLVERPPEFDEVKLYLSPGNRVEGAVVSTWADDPMPDVRIRARVDAASALAYGQDPLDPTWLGARVWEWRVRARDGGRFRIEGLPDGMVEIRALGQGRASERAMLVLPTKERARLYLKESRNLRGRVIDADTGDGVPGARIAAARIVDGSYLQETAVAFSEGDGSFVLEGLSAHLVSDLPLRIERYGYASVLKMVGPEMVARGGPVTIELRSPCVVEGKVLEEGGDELGEKCWVSLYRPGTGLLVDYVTSDARGRFTIDFAAPGETYDVLVTAERHEATGWEAVDLCSLSQLEAEMRPFPVLVGRIQASEYPLARPTVRVVFEDMFGNVAHSWDLAVDPSTGEFRSNRIPAGNYMLEASCGGYAPVRVGPIVLQQGLSDPVEVTIEMDRGARVRGVVLDAVTGAPVVGAYVTIGREGPGGTVQEWADAEVSARTDGQGRFQMENLPSGTSQWVVIRADGYAARYLKVAPAGGSVDLGKVLLERGARLVVQVESPDGRRRVVAWAAVTARGSPALSIQQDVPSDAMVFEGLGAGQWEIQAGIPAVTDSSRNLQVFAGSVTVNVGEEKRVRFVAYETVVRGRVLENGRLAPIALVAYVLPERPPSGMDGARVHRFNEADGRFELSGVPPGPARLVVEATEMMGGLSLERDIHVLVNGVLEVDFEIEGSTIGGRVVDSEGRPLGDVRVLAECMVDAEEDGRSMSAARVRGRTGGDGVFTLRAIRRGRLRLEFSKVGYGREIRFVDVGWEGGAEAEVVRVPEVVLYPEAVVWVCTRGAGVGDVAGRVTLLNVADERAQAEEGVRVPERGEGTMRFDGLASGRYRVEAQAEGFFPAEAEFELSEGEERSVTLELRRPALLRIRVKTMEGGAADVPVRVVDLESGRAVSEWLARGWFESSTGTMATDDEGRLVLRGLPEGRYRVEVGGVAKGVDVPATADEAEAAQVTLFLGG